MKIYEIGTGYTSIPAKISAATEIVVEELTKSMLKNDVDVNIVDIQDLERKENTLPIIEVSMPKIFVGTDVQLGIMHKLKRVVYSILLARRLKKILKNEKEKVVLHFHNQYNLFFFLKLTSEKERKNSIIAYTNHSGVWGMEWNQIEQTIKKRYFQEAECMKNADIVYVLNNRTKNNIIEHLGVPESKIVCIDNGVNIDTYTPLSKEEKLELKKKFDLENKKVFLQVGSVYENKGQERAVQLFAPLLKKIPESIYVYVGGIVSQEYQERVIECAKTNGISEKVKYMGMIKPGKDLNELYNIAEITILPSEYESFGMVIIESLSSGTPVLINAESDFLRGNGCVSYTKENFEEVVCSKILSEEDYKKVCKKARENAQTNYSWDVVSEKYLLAIKDRYKI